MRYRWVQEHRKTFDVAVMCRVLGLSRAAFYRPPVPANRRDAVVIAARRDGQRRDPNENLSHERVSFGSP